MSSPPRQRPPGPLLRRREKVFAVLPTLLTLGNAVCGFAAITYAARWWAGSDANTSLFAASCFIFLAMGFDAVDGSTARWAKLTSEFGAQLDSLCDSVSFGAAPAFLMIQFSLVSAYPPRLLWMIAALYVVCTVLRLARFNVETGEDDPHKSFSGLPSPAAAGTVASFPFMVFGLERLNLTEQDLLWEGFARWFDASAVGLLPVVTFAVAWLMVSRVPYGHIVAHLSRRRRNGQYLIQVVFVVALIFVVPHVSVPLLFCWYAFVPPARHLWTKHVTRAFRPRPPDAPAAEPPLPPDGGA